MENGVFTDLATLPPGAQLDTAALARMTGKCTESIRRAVRRGELPPPIKFLGKSVWLAGVIQKHIEERQAAAVESAEKDEKRRAAI